MLRQLGYRASLRLLPESTYFTYTNDSRNRAQVVEGGWSADYASADTFIGKLACNYFAPGDGQATTDASEFCDPAVDRQITRAAALQATDPRAAATQWAQLDRQLTDQAVFLPTVTPNEVDLLSSRAGDYEYNPVWGVLVDQLWVRLGGPPATASCPSRSSGNAGSQIARTVLLIRVRNTGYWLTSRSRFWYAVTSASCAPPARCGTGHARLGTVKIKMPSGLTRQRVAVLPLLISSRHFAYQPDR
jgi:hypothetical protein